MTQAQSITAAFTSTVVVTDPVQPEPGWWWNDLEPGRGFALEVQNNQMFFAGYLYDQGGAATWYAAQGAYDTSAGRFSGPLLAFRGGQCLTCAFIPPTQAVSPGQLTLTFSTPISGSLTWPGGTIPIKRVVYGTTDDYKRLAGQWVYTSVNSSLSTSNWLNFNQTYVSGGVNYVSGTIQGGRNVVGYLSAGSFGVLIDSSETHFDFFLFPVTHAGTAQLTNGREWLYLKTGTRTGPGNVAMAFKYGPAPTSIAASATSFDKVASMVEALRIALAVANEDSPKPQTTPGDAQR